MVGETDVASRLVRWLYATLALLACAVACSAPGEAPGVLQEALTPTQARVLGFEQPTVDWSSPSVTVGQSTTRTQGARSLSVVPNGWTEINSVPLSSLGQVRSELRLDVFVPSTVSWGEVRVVLIAPSLQLFWTELGSRSLTGAPVGQYRTLTFAIPPNVRTALGGTYNDLRIKVVVNAPALSNAYLLDNIIIAADVPDGGVGGSSAGGTGPGGAGSGGAGSGGTSNGGTANGGTSNGGTSNGGTANGGTANGGTANGGTSGTSGTSGTGGTGAQPQETLAVTVVLPVGTDPRRVGLGAMGDVYVADRARVVSSNRTWVPMVTNVGSLRTEIGADSSVGSIVSFGNVFLRSRSIINGDVFAKGDVEQQTNVAIAGEVFENQQTPPGAVDTAQFGWRVTLQAASTTPVMLEPNQTRALSAGSYGDVSVKTGALLDLSSGRRFRFRSMMIEPGGIIKVMDDLPTEIYVDASATYRGAVTTPTASTPPPLTMVIFGTGQMSFESTIRALMIAPQGKVVFGGVHRDFFGSVFAREVELRPDVILHHIGFGLPPGGPGTPPDPPPDPPDLPDPFVSATAHCGPRDRLSFSAWPMPGFCPAQLSLSPFTGTRTGELRWFAPLLASPVTRPIVGHGGDIYVITQTGDLFALSPDGHARWSVHLSGPAAQAPTVLRNGDILVPLQGGTIQAVSSSGQSLFTSVPVCSGDPTAITVDEDGNLVVGCSGGSAALLSLVTGTALWSVPTGAAVRHVPTVGNPGVILVTTDSALRRLSRQNGSTTWNHTLPGAPTGPAALVRDTAYVATANGSLVAVRTDGVVRFQTSLGGTPSGAPAVSPWGVILVPMQNGQIVAVDAIEGVVRSRATAGTNPLTQLIVGSDGVAYVQSSSQVFGLVPSTGTVLWTYALPGAARGISLADSGFVLATTDRAALAIGSSPSTIGGGGGEPPGGGPPGFTPVGCLAQKLATGVDECIPGGPGWADPTRITNGGGGSGGSGGGTSTTVGQSECVPATPPPNVTSRGLGGLGYLSTITNGIETGQLTFEPPASVPAGCELRFCEEDADGVEHEVDLPFARIAQNPAGLPDTEACEASGASQACPVDPGSKTDRVCESDSECNAGEVCAVFCTDATCQVYDVRCGLRTTCSNSGLAAEPTGPFNEQDPSTWPCESLLECAEGGEDFGAEGDPDLQKTGSLEQRSAPRDSFARQPNLIVPPAYPNYAETLAADPCNSSPIGGTSNSQLDARSGSSGNQKWGLFIEPDLSQKYDVELGEILALPNIDLEAIGSFRAGARVWGKEIEIINARAEALLSTCNAQLLPSLTVLGIQVQSWAAYASGDLPPAPEPPSDQDTLDCQNAVNSLNDKLANVKKGLHDARAAWDAYRRNGNVSPQALCDRTRAILGNVDPNGCTVASARAWLVHYQNLIRDLEGYVDGAYQSTLGQVAQKAEGAITFSPAMGGPLADIGASTHYPIGPVVLTLEIEVAGNLDATGRLVYSAGLDRLAAGTGGPKVSVEAAPGANVDAYVFVGVGFPGVSVGVEGQIRLIGVSAPITASLGLGRVGYLDPRPFASSGVFANVANGPSLLRNGTMQKWNAEWGYGAAVVLETLSGRINLAARVRLLFFKKTFRKKIADWKGLTKKYEFVGKLDEPLDGAAQSDVLMADVPYPNASGDLEAAFNGTPIGPNLPVTTLGGTSTPGACSCVDLNGTCTSTSDCCAGYQCVAQGGVSRCIVPPPPPPTPPPPPPPPPPDVVK